jgi:hyperosmotically inducible protein
MDNYRRYIIVALGIMFLLGSRGTAARSGQQAQGQVAVEGIRAELMHLPYYGVFDFLAFSYDRGTVTLMGYAYRPQLKHDAVRAVKQASNVDEVKDKIEELPVSTADDELRWRTYYAIYRDPFLSRYAPGGGLAHNGPFTPFGAGPFVGLEPAGDYSIHIIVKNLRTTLFGVVDNESDKALANTKAREVPGSFGVDNQLTVEGKQHEASK